MKPIINKIINFIAPAVVAWAILVVLDKMPPLPSFILTTLLFITVILYAVIVSVQRLEHRPYKEKEYWATYDGESMVLISEKKPYKRRGRGYVVDEGWFIWLQKRMFEGMEVGDKPKKIKLIVED
jgi:hypothetical protein